MKCVGMHGCLKKVIMASDDYEKNKPRKFYNINFSQIIFIALLVPRIGDWIVAGLILVKPIQLLL